MTREDHRSGVPGARWGGEGVAFVLQAPEAEAVEVCFYEAADSRSESASWPLKRGQAGLWEALIESASPGQLYGYRVQGPWAPASGHRFNASKLLLDPGAGAICGLLHQNDALGDFDHRSEERTPNLIDSAPFVPKSVVIDPSFDWLQDQSPRTPWEETFIYECHVRGMTQLHPQVPEPFRGTYLGLCHDAVVDHLLGLGVSAVELLPVQHFISEAHLVRNGLTNYFGYNPVGWIAPHAGYATGDRGEQVQEFKTMVRTLHRAGIEVLLDMVFNHTAEGNQLGPVLSFRGIDNRGYYRLQEADHSRYENFSGCGNTLHFGHRSVVDFTLDCLRYWVEEMHVDGFRFDLATTLGRDPIDFDPQASLLERIEQDPVLGAVKLIAEPWDVGPGGYQLGHFPARWREWNDRYRDTVRAFWRGDRGLVPEMTQRLDGSSDLLAPEADSSSSSINFVTSHDGFTLQDLVSYEHQHNTANGEDNRDGHHHNLSCNWGVEGPTDAPAVLTARLRAKKNLMATLAFSNGVPMLSHGDELGRSQGGNNNAYCHDSELTWVDWQIGPQQQIFLTFIQTVFSLRRQFILEPLEHESWISPHGQPLTPAELHRQRRHPFGWLRQSHHGSTLAILNNGDRVHLFQLPSIGQDGHWQMLLNTDQPGERTLRGSAVRISPRSLLLLRYRAREAPSG